MPETDALEMAHMRFSGPRPAGKSPLKPPEGSESYSYVTSRLLSFWPVVNGNGATFVEDDCEIIWKDKSNFETSAVTKLANLWHDKGVETGNRIIGSIVDQAHIPGVGIDILSAIDKKAAKVYGVVPEDFQPGGEYSSNSMEMYCDRKKSRFIIIKKPESPNLDDQKVYSAAEAASMGIRRTSPDDPEPYLYEGKYRVAEACVPIRLTGVGYLDDPAEKTAQVFEIAANRGHVDKVIFLEQASSYAETNVPSMGDNPFDSLLDKYQSIGPSELSELDDSKKNALPDGAFGATYSTDDSHANIRKLPLYKTPEDHKAGKPSAGLVKAAMEALTTGFRGERVNLPTHVHAEARKAVRAAHDKLFPPGAKTKLDPTEKAALEKALTDPLHTEIANLKSTHATELANALATKADVEKQRDEVMALVEQRDAEIASLKAEKEDAKAVEAAKTRVAELKTLGLDVTAEEEAALVVALKTENDDKFEIRKRDVEIAKLKKAGGKSAEEQAAATAAAEETAAALAALGGGAGSTFKLDNPEDYI